VCVTVDDPKGTYIDGAAADPPWVERRRTPRVRVPGRLVASLIGDDTPVTVINLGLGGFRVQSAAEFLVASSHEFRFELSDRSTLVVGARVVYCLLRQATDGTIAYLTGFEFADEPQRDNRSAAEEILQDLAFQLSLKSG
jgi:hypothetical protein